jgi:glucose-6-phosphate isomerase/transaldolase/glucose-6-phosphate isomerase
LNEATPGELVSGSPSAFDAARRALDDLAGRRIPRRIRDRDHTVWRSGPREISDRLGWLDAGAFLRPHLEELASFSRGIQEEGYRDVVLLGMGGSCLGPEVLRCAFGSADGHPRLTVLDSTVPGQVSAVAESVDPAHTLFIVSSKSGGTIETLSFYRYFRDLAERSLPGGHAGRNFVAITDVGTPLERLGIEAGFRRVFLNPADIGGRYSVLSWFGMLPAALIGIDVARILDSSANMRDQCLSDDADCNPGLRLGALLGSMSLAGRDKVTLITPPPGECFGLWVEQMIAESLGKEGRGIVPVAGEPLLSPDAYGDDRLFVYLRTPQGEATDAATLRLAEAGHPLAQLDLSDCYDLGAEFFRWEYATAVAGSMLDVHPFDQPDVQGAKDNTDGLLDTFLRNGRLPERAPSGSIAVLLEQAGPGDYFAITPYLPLNAETDSLLYELRSRVMQRCRIATTAGYGPRYLHSTGQLHKGGQGSGLFLQLTIGSHAELPIPGQRYGFDILAGAQAIGDYQALANLGRRQITVNLGDDPVAGIRRLLDEL